MNKIACLSAILATTLAFSQSASAKIYEEANLKISNLMYHSDKNPTLEARHTVAVFFSTDLTGGTCDKGYFSDSNSVMISLLNAAMLAGKSVAIAYDDKDIAKWTTNYCYIVGVTVSG